MKTGLLYLGITLLCIINLDGQNLISNGDFEGAGTGWWNGAGGGGAAAFTCPVTGTGNVHAGTNALRSNVTTAGANAWDVQTIHSGFTATPGLAHSLTFWAKSATAGRQVRIVIQNTTYAAQDFTLSAVWAQYTFNFIPSEASLQVKIHYTQSGDFFFDDFFIDDPSGGPALITTTISSSTSYQEMVGFGGALTWYCDRITSSANKNTLADLMFTDLGLDILRLKNWYYPLNYPSNKSTITMDPDWFKPHFDATNELYTMAKTRNPNIDVLLCSWSPPVALKSNNALNEGTLKKNVGQFMYQEFAQYWEDILDNISFVPDYISIQNEPGYVNAGWETCEWRPTETGTYPGYDRALDSVYNRIKNRAIVPKMLGAEPENLGSAGWDPSANTFREMTTPIQNKSYLYGYAYHLYNYYGGAGSIDASNLNMIRDEFGNRPAFMTEFGSTNYDWVDVGRMIHANLVEANTAAYIYWELGWDAASTETMIGLDNAGNYDIRDLYYSVKHYAKYIDKGYTRIAASGSNATYNVTAFRNPAGNQITLVAINNHTSDQPIDFDLDGITILNAEAYRSEEGNFWQELGSVDLSTTQNLPANSITTYVIGTGILPVTLIDFEASSENEYVALSWNVSSENKVKAHHVLRSLNPSGMDWDTIGSVAAFNHHDRVEHYSLNDHQIPNVDVLYYQLISEDLDGSVSYSKVITVPIGNQGQSVCIYPNPSSDEFTIQLKGNSECQISILNSIGKTIQIISTRGSDQISFGKEFKPGVYVVEIKNEHQVQVYRIVKE